MSKGNDDDDDDVMRFADNGIVFMHWQTFDSMELKGRDFKMFDKTLDKKEVTLALKNLEISTQTFLFFFPFSCWS